MLFLRALCILLALFILLPVPAFYSVPCLHLFLVFFHFTPVIAFRFWFFCNFPYTENLYKPQYVQTLDQSTSINKVKGEASNSPVWLLLSLIFSPFLGCQTPSKDDNLEDERLKPFLLEAEGYWVQDLEATGGPLFFT